MLNATCSCAAIIYSPHVDTSRASKPHSPGWSPQTRRRDTPAICPRTQPSATDGCRSSLLDRQPAFAHKIPGLRSGSCAHTSQIILRLADGPYDENLYQLSKTKGKRNLNVYLPELHSAHSAPQTDARRRCAATASLTAVPIAFVCNLNAPLRHPTAWVMKQSLPLRGSICMTDILKPEQHAKGLAKRANYVILTRHAAPPTIHRVEDARREAFSASTRELNQ